LGEKKDKDHDCWWKGARGESGQTTLVSGKEGRKRKDKGEGRKANKRQGPEELERMETGWAGDRYSTDTWLERG